MTQQQIPTSEVLNLVADYIQVFGWANDYGSGAAGWNVAHGQPACLEGAGKIVCGQLDRSWHFDVRLPLVAYLTDRFPEHINPKLGEVIAFSWNDAPERTAAEVIEVLRATAVIEAAREDATVEVPAGPRPGDLCRILAGGLIEHQGCDQHRDGVVTNVRTGEVEVSA